MGLWVCRSAKCLAENYEWNTHCYKCEKAWLGSEKMVSRPSSKGAKRRAAQAKTAAEVDSKADQLTKLIEKALDARMPKPASPAAAAAEPAATPKPSKPIPPPPPAPPRIVPAVAENGVTTKLKNNMKDKHLAVVALIKCGQADSQAVVVLRAEIKDIEQRLEELVPVDTRIENVSSRLVSLQEARKKVADEIKDLEMDLNGLDIEIGETVTHLSALQTRLHADVQQTKVKKVTDKQAMLRGALTDLVNDNPGVHSLVADFIKTIDMSVCGASSASRALPSRAAGSQPEALRKRILTFGRAEDGDVSIASSDNEDVDQQELADALTAQAQQQVPAVFQQPPAEPPLE
jgi:hypothetical protein